MTIKLPRRKVFLLTVSGAKLTSLRVKRQKWGQDEVARRMGVDKSTICRWEQELANPSQDQVFQLVELFGTDNFIRLNGKAVLTAEEIEVVRKLREG